jgi:hypothetical protein
MTGPGKYDDECSALREQTGAAVAICVIIDGKQGHGFSCQVDRNKITEEQLFKIPNGLRQVADQMEKDFKELTNENRTGNT